MITVNLKGKGECMNNFPLAQLGRDGRNETKTRPIYTMMGRSSSKPAWNRSK